MNHSELAHYWANHHYGRNGGQNAGNMSTSESLRAIYSYGSHYTIARHVDFLKDYDIIMSTERYSVSTGQHNSHVANAIANHKRVLYVNRCPYSGDSIEACKANMKENALHEIGEAMAIAKKIPRAKSCRGDYIKSVNCLVANAEHLRKLFKITWKSLQRKDANHVMEQVKFWRMVLKGDWVEADVKRTEKQLAAERRERKLASERRARAQAERMQLAEDSLASWLKSEGLYFANLNLLPVALRVKGDYVETSHGANVGLEAARRLWPLAKRCHDKGESFRPEEPVKLGIYRLNHIDSKGNVTIGCHTITFEAMERVREEVFNA